MDTKKSYSKEAKEDRMRCTSCKIDLYVAELEDITIMANREVKIATLCTKCLRKLLLQCTQASERLQAREIKMRTDTTGAGT